MPTEREFAGFARGGHFIPDFPEWVTAWLVDHEGKRITATLDDEHLIRSTAQNRRHFGQLVRATMGAWNADRELPLHKDQVHWSLKGAFLGWVETPLGLVQKSSKDRTVPEFKQFMEDTEEYLVTKYGILIPSRDEDLV